VADFWLSTLLHIASTSVPLKLNLGASLPASFFVGASDPEIAHPGILRLFFSAAAWKIWSDVCSCSLDDLFPLFSNVFFSGRSSAGAGMYFLNRHICGAIEPAHFNSCSQCFFPIPMMAARFLSDCSIGNHLSVQNSRRASPVHDSGILAALQNGPLNLSATRSSNWLFLAFFRRICDQVFPLFFLPPPTFPHPRCIQWLPPTRATVRGRADSVAPLWLRPPQLP